MSSTTGEGEGGFSGDPLQEVAVPVNISEESAKWLTAFQDHSILANFNEDCLLLILSKLPMSDVFHVGLSCRRLFYYFKQSCRPRHKSLVLLKGGHKANFNNVTFEIEEGSETITEQQADPLLIQIGANQLLKLMPQTFTQNLFDIFPNLTLLQVEATFNKDDFARLIDQLNTSLPQLITLKLSPRFDKSSIASTSIASCLRPLCQLQPPSLKHLMLYLCSSKGKVFTFPSENEKKKKKQKIRKLKMIHKLKKAEKKPLYLPLLSQLTSFCFFLDNPTAFSTIYPFIRNVYSVPNLAPGEDARFGCSFNYTIAKELKQEEVELLPYITYLNININFPFKDECYEDIYEYHEDELPWKWLCLYSRSMESLFGLLPQVSNLVKFKLRLGIMDACADYPGLLAALANLQHLKAVSLDYDFNDMVKHGCKWERSSLHILPTVRTLSISYSTENYDDVVEQFHLLYVFPGLTHFKCSFVQDDSGIGYERYDDYDPEDVPERVQTAKFKRAGWELTKGLKKLPAEVKKKIDFSFCNQSAYFSMEEMIALQPRRYQNFQNFV